MPQYMVILHDLLNLIFSFTFALVIKNVLLPAWSRVLLGKLTVNFAASQQILRIYGTRMSLTVPTSARHLFCLQRKHLYMGNF
jgi:hypothetical protein